VKGAAAQVRVVVRSFLIVVIACLTASLASASVVSSQDKQPEIKYVPDRIIVGFKSNGSAMMRAHNLTSNAVNALNTRYRLTSIKPLYPAKAHKGISASSLPGSSDDVFILEFAKGTDPVALAKEYSKLPEVRYAEPDYIRHAMRTDPNDTYWSTSGSWGQSYRDQWDMEIMRCPDAWDIQTGSASTVIAVIDSGIDYNHPDIIGNLWQNPGEIPGNGIDDDGNGFVDDYIGYDFCNNDGDPMDDHGHGTHVSGTIGAVGNNSVGISGVNWNCSIMSLKILDSSGNGSDSDLAAAIIYAADMGAQVINMSLGGDEYSQTIHDAFVYAHQQRGCVLVIAAGNANSNLTSAYPGWDNMCITVAASDQNDAKCYFTNYGVKIAVSAPGGGPTGSTPPCAQYNCLSLRAAKTDRLPASCGPGVGIIGEDYYRQAGTSMACPHVAGLAGLILSQNPTWTNEQVRQAIQMRADDILTPGFDTKSGFGRINAYASVTSPEPMEAMIIGPSNGEKVWNRVVVNGIAAGPNFTSYTLDYGSGREPSTWTTIYTGSEPVRYGPLAAFEPNQLVPGVYTLRLRTTGSGAELDGAYRIEIVVDSPEGSGHFTELFDTASAFDLDNLSLEFTPDGSNGFYSLCLKEINELPTDPSGGTVLQLDEDDYKEVILDSAQVSLYGKTRDRFYVGSNGYVTFDAGDTSWSETFSQHFSHPRISALFDDLSPVEGTVSWIQLADRVAVTFEDVPEYGSSEGNTFQIEMFFDGRIVLSYLGISAEDGLVGLSEGEGTPAGFTASDLSRYDHCNLINRAVQIMTPNGGEYFEPEAGVSIQWATSGIDWVPTDKVNLLYSIDSGDWTPISGASGLAYHLGSFNWDTTGLAESNKYLVRIEYAGDDSISDTSDDYFTIATDEIPPAITHNPLSNTKNQAGPYHVCANVTDAYGVESVTLFWSKNGGAFNQVAMQSTAYPNEYCASIPGPSVIGDQYCYYIVAQDASSAQNLARDPQSDAYCFEILDCKPATPVDPTPADNSNDASINSTLSWKDGEDTVDLVNGGFETGDFTGWSVGSGDGNVDQWVVATTDEPGWSGDGHPFEGTYYAQNGFDGAAGQYIDLYQEIAVPSWVSSLALRWSDRLQWDITHNATKARGYSVTIQPAGGGSAIAELYSTTLEPMTSGDTGYVTHTVDLLALAPSLVGKTMRVNFHLAIPESYTGPAQIDLDAISLILDPLQENQPSATISGEIKKHSMKSQLLGRQAYEKLRAAKLATPVINKRMPANFSAQEIAEHQTTFDVLFGKSSESLDLIATGLTEPAFNPGPLERRTKYYWRVVAHNDCGGTEGPLWSFTTESAPITKPANGASVELRQVALTEAKPGYFYVETRTRESGIRVEKASHGLSIGDVVNITGTMRTNANYERYVEAAEITNVPLTEFIKPLGMANKSVGGSDWFYNPSTGAGQRGIDGCNGLNNIGLLVSVWGKVVSKGRGWFYIDDGSSVKDGTGITGIYCELPEGVAAPSVGEFVRVTGISSCELYEGALVSVIALRNADDIYCFSGYFATSSLVSSHSPRTLQRPRDVVK
jgi:subtilisin family serine protease